MFESQVRLRRGSTALLKFDDPNQEGWYRPLTLDRDALRADGTEFRFIERQPDGFLLKYGRLGGSAASGFSAYPGRGVGSTIGGVDAPTWPSLLPPWMHSQSSAGSASGGLSSSSGGGSGSGSESSSGSESESSSESGESSGASSGSSGASGSSSSGYYGDTCALDCGSGVLRNLLPINYAVPFLGTPIDEVGAEHRANQPMLCTIDQEVFCEPGQPTPGLYNPAAALVSARYSANGQPNALDRAVREVQEFVHGWSLPPYASGNDCGAVSGTCSVNLSNGNLLLSFGIPGGGPADPPVRFFYNSLCRTTREFGVGWSCLFEQWVEWNNDGPYCEKAFLDEMENVAGLRWTCVRDSSNRLLRIEDPFDQETSFAYSGGGKIESVTDSRGRATAFFVNTASGFLDRVAHPDSTQTQFEYDDRGRLTRWINPDGDEYRFDYDDLDRLVQIRTPDVDQQAVITSIEYPNETTRVVTDPEGFITTLTLDASDNIATVQRPLGVTIQQTWDGLQRLLSITDGRNHTTQFVYDSMADRSRRLKEIRRPIGTLAFVYDAPTSRTKAIIDQLAHVTTLVWDTLVADRLPGVLVTLTDAEAHTFVYAHNANGQISSITDPLNHRTTWTHDDKARRIKITNAESNEIEYIYQGGGAAIGVKNPEDNPTTLTYDAQNRLAFTTDGNSNTTSLGYDGNGRLTTLTNALGRAWTRAYFATGNLESETDPNNNTVRYEYDRNSNLTTLTSARGKVTQSAFDALNRLRSTTDPTGATTTFSYDNADNLTTLTNALNNTWTFEYDDNDRLSYRTDPLNHTTSFAYDAAGNPTGVRDALMNWTTTTYDKLHRVETIEEPAPQSDPPFVTTYAYDAAGRLTTVTDAEGRATTYEYDDADRLIAEHDARSMPRKGVTRYLYDGAGRVKEARVRSSLSDTIDGGMRTTYTYDVGGRLIAVESPRLPGTDLTKVVITTYQYDAANQVTTIIDPEGHPDPEGHTSTRAYDPGGRLTTVSDNAGAITTFAYNQDNQLESVTDPTGVTTEYVYDDAGRPQRVKVPYGLGTADTVFLYDAAGNRTTLTDGENESTRFLYDAANRLTTVITPEGKATQYAYDAADRLTTITDANNKTRVYDYDPAGRVVAEIDGNNVPMYFEYDKVGRETKRTVWDNREFKTEYDEIGNVTARVTPLNHRTEYTYDPAGRLLTTTDANGKQSGLAYDSRGMVATYTDAVGRATGYVYNRLGALVKLTHPGGATREFTYDVNGNVLTVKQENGFSTTFTYDSAGRLRTRATAVGPDGLETSTVEFIYDAGGRLTTQVSGEGLTQVSTYDKAGRIRTQANGANETTTYEYNGDGLMTASISPRGVTTTYDYDGVGNLRHVTDPMGRVTEYQYDGNNRQTVVIDARSFATTSVYDNAGRLTVSIDEEGQRTTFTYDNDDRLVSITRPDSKVITYTYDNAGNILTVHEPDDTYTARTYYDDGQVENETVSTGQGGPVRQETTFTYDNNGFPHVTTVWTDDGTLVVTETYDPVGNRLLINSGGSITTTLYDAAYRLYSEERIDVLTEYTLDKDGRRRVMRHRVGTGSESITTMTWDGASRLRVMEQADGKTTYTYDADGRCILQELASGIVFSMSYDDSDNLVVKEEIAQGSVVLRRITYTYDQIGNLLEEYGSLTTYMYDKTSQLRVQNRARTLGDPLGWYQLTVDGWYGLTVDEWYGMFVTNPNYLSQSFYDAMGNVSFELTGAGVVAYVYDSTGGNRVLTRSIAGQTHTFTYDALGRRTEIAAPGGDSATFEWDPLGRLVVAAVTESGQTTEVTYTYDADGYLRSRDEGDGDISLFNWDGTLLIAETDHNGYPKVEYGTIPSGHGWLATLKRADGGMFYPAWSPSGTVEAIYNEDQHGIQRTFVDSFGRIYGVSASEGQGGENDPVLGFAGAMGIFRDRVTGLYYFRQRWYDPMTRQFISPDPLGPGVGDPNRYRLAHNNTLRFSDASGLDYISIKDGQVFWVVEEKGILWNRDIDRIPLGRRSGGQVELLSAFRGGTMDLRALRRAAGYSWSHGYDIGEVYAHSRSTEATSRKIAVGMIDAILKDLRRGKNLDQRGRELTGWEDVVGAYYEGLALGVASTGLTLADSLTFGQVDGINRLNNRLWEDAGLAGSGWQVGSQIASRIGVEVGLTALTLGTGAALRGAQAAAQAGGAAEKGSRIVRGAKALANTANSPMAAQARTLAGGSRAGTTALRSANWSLRGWEAVNAVADTTQGVRALANGDPWGALQVFTGALGGVGAVAGGYGAARRALGGTGLLAAGSHTGRLAPVQVTRNSLAAWRLRTKNSFAWYYHGTDDLAAASLRRSGIDLKQVRANLDFNTAREGFYFAETRAHAVDMAGRTAGRKAGRVPSVVAFKVKKRALGRLRMLDFSGDVSEDWVLFVRLNRGTLPPSTQVPSYLTEPWWDVVRGRTAARFDPVAPLHDWVQVCIRTPEAVKLFNAGML